MRGLQLARLLASAPSNPCRDTTHGLGGTYLAFPGKVVLGLPAPVQRDQKVRTGVSILHGKTGLGHLLAGSCVAGVSSMFQNFEVVQWPSNRTGGLREAHGALDGLGDGHFANLEVQ